MGKNKKKQTRGKKKVRVGGRTGNSVVGQTSANGAGFGLAGLSTILEMNRLKNEREGIEAQIKVQREQNMIVGLRNVFADKAYREKEQKNAEEEFKAGKELENLKQSLDLEKERWAQRHARAKKVFSYATREDQEWEDFKRTHNESVFGEG